MTRRNFIQALYNIVKSIVVMVLMPSISSSATNAQPGLHYKPLAGKSLRGMAREKRHHAPDGFVNPLGPERQGRLWQVMRWKLFQANRFEPFFAQEQIVPVTIDWEQLRHHRGLSITYLKHSTIMIKDGGETVIIDPVFWDIFWFIKDFTPLKFDLAEMPAPRHVLITHGHYDHLDKRSLSALEKDVHVISPLGYNGIFNDLRMKNRTQLDWYDVYQNDKLEITLLPCNHWTMRNPLTGPNRSLWGSYLIKTAGGYTIYVSGDTAYFDGFEQLGKEYEIDLAIFNLGAYEPRWFMAPSHMNPQECIQAFKELDARQMMIVHWGTFRLGDEPVHFPRIQVKQALQEAGLLDRWVDLQHGQTLFVDAKIQTS
jgi:L-ascorbate metabolism protein UlaG (beta-lactamase superfamily)